MRIEWVMLVGLAVGCGASNEATSERDGAAPADTILGDRDGGEIGVHDATPDVPIDSAVDAWSDASDGGPIACKNEGGQACAKGGDPAGLYTCAGGSWRLLRTCDVCETMPDGVPDRCRSDLVVPKSLVDALDVTPYVEGSCVPATFAGWPYEARTCTYSAGGITTKVTVANPKPARVAAWIVDSSTFIPRLWALRTLAPAQYEAGLKVIAAGMLAQSSRIFPLQGGIIENMGSGYVNYPFYKGVTEGCSSGCYCRINSLHRTEWCAYVALLGSKGYDACIAEVGASGLTAAWGDRCLQNHVDAWTATSNAHFRAKAHRANKAVAAACPTASACTPAEVVAAMKGQF